MHSLISSPKVGSVCALSAEYHSPTCDFKRFSRPIHYTIWAPKQPNDNNGTLSGCAAMDGKTIRREMKKGGYWYDLECNRTLPALCQITSRKPPANKTSYPGRCPDVSINVCSFLTKPREHRFLEVINYYLDKYY